MYIRQDDERTGKNKDPCGEPRERRSLQNDFNRWLVIIGQVAYSRIAEKGSKMLILGPFSEKCPVGASLGLLVCFWTHWRVKVSILRG